MIQRPCLLKQHHSNPSLFCCGNIIPKHLYLLPEKYFNSFSYSKNKPSSKFQSRRFYFGTFGNPAALSPHPNEWTSKRIDFLLLLTFLQPMHGCQMIRWCAFSAKRRIFRVAKWGRVLDFVCRDAERHLITEIRKIQNWYWKLFKKSWKSEKVVLQI